MESYKLIHICRNNWEVQVGGGGSGGKHCKTPFINPVCKENQKKNPSTLTSIKYVFTIISRLEATNFK